MKHYTRTCDVCDETLYKGGGPWYDYFLPRVRLVSFTDFAQRNIRLDVCSECWGKFGEWAREQLETDDE